MYTPYKLFVLLAEHWSADCGSFRDEPRSDMCLGSMNQNVIPASGSNSALTSMYNAARDSTDKHIKYLHSAKSIYLFLCSA